MDAGEFIAILLACVVISFGFGVFAGNVSFKDEAAKTECAQYNPITGNFEWIK